MKIIRENLETVFDPEIPANVVDLGLIYRVRLKTMIIWDELHM